MSAVGRCNRAAIFAGALMIAGCGRGDWQVATYPATGRVTINGKPAEGALVQLQSTGGQADVRDSRPWGKVRADGTYTLATYSDGGAGAPPGEYAVMLTWPVDASVLGSPDRLKGKFAEPGRAKVTLTVKAGDNELTPITLDGVDVDAKPAPPRRGEKVMPGSRQAAAATAAAKRS